MNISVVTGGSSGIGLATARLLGRSGPVVIAGRSQQKLDVALAELRREGIDAHGATCDVSDREAVQRLVSLAQSLGTITAVVHCAGLSPHMGDARTILQGNALGTIHVNDAFAQVMSAGSCIVHVASMAAYLIPSLILPTAAYRSAHRDHRELLERLERRVNLFPASKRASVAYGISKNFVVWYAKSAAVQLGARGIRVLSVSPGTFDTPMAELEKEGTEGYPSPLGRSGHPDEIASLIAFCASDRPGYLTGTDILCDGGSIARAGSPLLDKVSKGVRAALGRLSAVAQPEQQLTA